MLINSILVASTYFFNSFDKYFKSIQRFLTTIGDKLDLIGCEEGAKRGLFTTRFLMKDKSNVYMLGDRIEVLKSVDPGFIMLQVGDRNQKYPFETIFKAVTRLLLDNASSEYIFSCEFFGQGKNSEMSDMINAAFNGVFDPTFRSLQVNLLTRTRSSSTLTHPLTLLGS
jgi:hypothetical protein